MIAGCEVKSHCTAKRGSKDATHGTIRSLRLVREAESIAVTALGSRVYVSSLVARRNWRMAGSSRSIFQVLVGSRCCVMCPKNKDCQ